MAQYTDLEMFVFLDESAVDNHTVRRACGWSAVVSPAVERSTFLQGVRHSILPALTSQGMLALDIFEGSVNKEHFIHFLHKNIVCLSFVYAVAHEDSASIIIGRNTSLIFTFSQGEREEGKGKETFPCSFQIR